MRTKRTPIHASAKSRPIIAITAEENVVFATAEGEADKKGPPKFSVVAYTGVQMDIAGYDLPIVVDLEGMEFGNSLKANLDHESSQRVGHVTERDKSNGQLKLSGVASARTSYRDEVTGSAEDGFDWQASIEAMPLEFEEVGEGESASANGRNFDGPVLIARKSRLKGFAFVSHGADDNTSATIAARAASKQEQKTMKIAAKAKAWIEGMGLDIEALSDEQVTNLVADFDGREGTREVKATAAGDGAEKRRLEAQRRKAIMKMAEDACDSAIEAGDLDGLDAIIEARDEAIKGKVSASDFRYELMLATHLKTPPSIHKGIDKTINEKVLEAAICQAGGLKDYNTAFKEEVNERAHEEFRGRISLTEVYAAAAQANGFGGRLGGRVNHEMHNAAFGLAGPNGMVRAGGFSQLALTNVFKNVANKFMKEGFMSVDQTILRIAAIRPVNDFKKITTVSLTGAMMFQAVGADGELKLQSPGEVAYNNQAFPAGVLYAITYVDQRNDDLGCLTAMPKRIGRGGMLYVNHIGWTAFLNNSSFFHSSNNNVNTGVADATIGGLTATEKIFLDQTDYDGKPLGVEGAIWLVPTALKAPAQTLMTSERLITGSTTTQGDGNIFKDRYRVESSPYMSNSAYTGYDAAANYLIADPQVMPVLEIVALDGQIQPTVETAEAAFNVLGTQMRGELHVGAAKQEKKGGVRADGGTS